MTISYNNFHEYIDNYNLILNESIDNLKKRLSINLLFNRDTIDIPNNLTEQLKIYYKLFDGYITYKYNLNYPLRFYDHNIQKIHEGPIYTTNLDFYEKKLKELLSIQNFESIIVYENNSFSPIVYINFLLNEYNIHKEEFNKLTNLCGYFISLETVYEDINNIIIKVEPKFLTECTDYVYNKLNCKLYHITLTLRVNKILNQGLIPKEHNKISITGLKVYFYPFNISNELTIFFKQYQKNEILKRQAIDLYKKNGNYIDNVKKYLNDNKLQVSLLEIDLSKYSRLHYRFFWDPNQPLGIFTYEAIPNICIKEIEKIYI